MALAVGDDMKGLRDRALLLVGFAGAFRRSELVALNVEDLEESELGYKVTIRHSKTDQEGAGQTIAKARAAFRPSPPGRSCPSASRSARAVARPYLSRSSRALRHSFPAVHRPVIAL
jgi:integrase